VNNTIADNESPTGGQVVTFGDAGIVSMANNAIVGPPTGPAVLCFAVSPTFTTNDVYAGGVPAAGGTCATTATTGTNMSAPPDFVNGVHGRPYHLSPASPLVDAGTNAAAVGLRRDIVGRKRIIDGGHGPIIDIGAVEYAPH
jgi:hypothetical protein